MALPETSLLRKLRKLRRDPLAFVADAAIVRRLVASRAGMPGTIPASKEVAAYQSHRRRMVHLKRSARALADRGRHDLASKAYAALYYHAEPNAKSHWCLKAAKSSRLSGDPQFALTLLADDEAGAAPAVGAALREKVLALLDLGEVERARDEMLSGRRADDVNDLLLLARCYRSNYQWKNCMDLLQEAAGEEDARVTAALASATSFVAVLSWWMEFSYGQKLADDLPRIDWDQALVAMRRAMNVSKPDQVWRLVHSAVALSMHKLHDARDSASGAEVRPILTDLLDLAGFRRETDGTLIETVIACFGAGEGGSNALRDTLARLDAAVFHHEQWLVLETLATWSGLFVAAMVARAKAREACRFAVELRTAPRQTGILTLLEGRNTKEARRSLLQLAERDASVPPRTRRLLAYCDLLEGDAGAMAREVETTHGYCADLAAYLRDKRVAIVGPVPTGLNGAEIDGFDVVVRLNSLGSPYHDPSGSGTRTDVSIFNVERLRALAGSHRAPLRMSEDVRYVVLKNKKVDVSFEDGPKVVHFGGILGEFQFRGAINSLPEACVFLLSNLPARLKVFNATCFASERAYDLAYRSKITLRSLVWSDDVSQSFSILKTLAQNGLIEADDGLRRVLALKHEEYLAELQSLYGWSVGPMGHRAVEMADDLEMRVAV